MTSKELEELAGIKEECKKCMRYKNSCKGTDYFHNRNHYYCIIDWGKYKKGFAGTRFKDMVF